MEAAIKPCPSALLGELKFTTCDGGVHMQGLEDSREPRAEGPGVWSVTLCQALGGSTTRTSPCNVSPQESLMVSRSTLDILQTSLWTNGPETELSSK